MLLASFLLSSSLKNICNVTGNPIQYAKFLFFNQKKNIRFDWTKASLTLCIMRFRTSSLESEHTLSCVLWLINNWAVYTCSRPSTNVAFKACWSSAGSCDCWVQFGLSGLCIERSPLCRALYPPPLSRLYLWGWGQVAMGVAQRNAFSICA